MTEFELRTRVHNAAMGALNDQGVLSEDQATAIGKAILAAIDTLLDIGAIEAPRVTRSQKADLLKSRPAGRSRMPRTVRVLA